MDADMDRLLLITILLPLLGALVVLLQASRGGPAAAKQVALVTSLIVLGTTGVLVWNFPHEKNVFAESALDWLSAESAFNVQLSVGLDGLSIWLFGLSALLMVTSVLVSWEAIRDRQAAFYALLLVLETGLLGVFAARDIVLFYIFFEFTLVPLYFLIGIWGSEARRYAAIKFFIYTLAGSMLTFLGISPKV
jgi:NADH-quinone oxidoreductase subunit M